MASRDLEAVWTVLETERPSSGIEVSGLGNGVVAGELLLGVDADLRRHLLIPLLPGEAAPTDMQGQAVHLVRLGIDGAQFLAFVCLQPDLNLVFTQFCRELIASLADAS